MEVAGKEGTGSGIPKLATSTEVKSHTSQGGPHGRSLTPFL